MIFRGLEHLFPWLSNHIVVEQKSMLFSSCRVIRTNSIWMKSCPWITRFDICTKNKRLMNGPEPLNVELRKNSCVCYVVCTKNPNRGQWIAQWGVCIMAAHSNRWLLRGKWVAGQSVRCCFPVFGKELTVSFALALGRFFSSKGCQIERFILNGTSIKG